MADPLETGNPVFDYRAKFRVRANRWQRILIVTGIELIVVYLVLLSFVPVVIGWVFGLAGVGLLTAGILWGFYWRRMIRDEFRQKYGDQ